jgi:hypothetical protein
MTGIAKLRHRVVLCRQEDVITGGEMRLNRADAGQMWASVTPKKASTFSLHGAAIKEAKDARTHVIAVRYRPELNVSLMAWIYEARLKSSPRWFKVLSVNQTEDGGTPFFLFDCRLTERGDEIAEPTDPAQGPVVGLPNGVVL